MSLICSSEITQGKNLSSFVSGFEQANKYVILDAAGNHVGYMAEQEKGMASLMARQWFRTHRSFVTHVFDRHENEVLRVSFPALVSSPAPPNY